MILLWGHVDADLKVPTHPLCGGGCELSYDRKRIEEATAVVLMMKRMKVNDLPHPSTR